MIGLPHYKRHQILCIWTHHRILGGHIESGSGPAPTLEGTFGPRRIKEHLLAEPSRDILMSRFQLTVPMDQVAN